MKTDKIDIDDNSLDFDLAKSVGAFFQLETKQMDEIITQVTVAVSSWEKVASEIGIPRSERQLMAAAFRF